jgi:membrane fusion protein (multidrug efflux system)
MMLNDENKSELGTDELPRPKHASSGIDSVDLDVPPEEGVRSRRKWFLAAGIGIAVFAGLAAAPMANRWMHYESTDDAFIEADITPMAPKIDGYVQVVNATDNQHVKKGDVLVQIDPRDRQVKLDQASAKLSAARADVEQSRANIETVRANIATAQAEIDASKADADYAKSQADRYRNMTDGAASENERQNAFAAERANSAKVSAAQSRLLAANAQLSTAKAQLASAQAQVNVADAVMEQAQLELSYTKIVAPVNGRVTKKNVQPGAYIQPGQTLLAVVPDEVWVIANFKETQLELMTAGQAVDLKVDAYPNQKFTGTVDSIQAGTGARFSALPPENATGNYVKVVQRVPVKIVLDRSDTALLAPGMSVTPEVKVK